jgi:hypothetical protein
MFAEHISKEGVPASRHMVFGDRAIGDAPDSIAKQNNAIDGLCELGHLEDSGMRDHHSGVKWRLTSSGWMAVGKSVPKGGPKKGGNVVLNGKQRKIA